MELRLVKANAVNVENKFRVHLPNVFKEESRAKDGLVDKNHKPIQLYSDGSFVVRQSKNKKSYEMIYGHSLWPNIGKFKIAAVQALVYSYEELNDEQAYELIFNKDLQSGFLKFKEHERAFKVFELHNLSPKQYSKAKLARWNGVTTQSITNWLIGVKMYEILRKSCTGKKMQKMQWTHLVKLGEKHKLLKNGFPITILQSLVEQITNSELSVKEFLPILESEFSKLHIKATTGGKGGKTGGKSKRVKDLKKKHSRIGDAVKKGELISWSEFMEEASERAKQYSQLTVRMQKASLNIFIPKLSTVDDVKAITQYFSLLELAANQVIMKPNKDQVA